MPLFVFGTLRDREVLEIVLARAVAADSLRSATLADFCVVRLPDESYPILIPALGELADGAIIADLQAEDMKRIEFFESEEYTFRECKVSVDGAAIVDAVYCSEGTVAQGAVEPWDLEHWHRTHKAGFVDKIRQYMALYGHASIEEAERLWSEMEGRT